MTIDEYNFGVSEIYIKRIYIFVQSYTNINISTEKQNREKLIHLLSLFFSHFLFCSQSWGDFVSGVVRGCAPSVRTLSSKRKISGFEEWEGTNEINKDRTNALTPHQGCFTVWDLSTRIVRTFTETRIHIYTSFSN